MSLHRRAAKRDAAEPVIVETLEAHGCIVWRLSGKGLTDLVVFHPKARKADGFGTHRHTFVADVKGPKEKATPAQEEKWGALTALGFAVFILRTPEDATKMLNNALEPWEPSDLTLPSERHPALITAAKRAAKRYAPRKGDAAKARGNDVTAYERKVRIGKAPMAVDLVVSGYTPPLSTPVDAAKEAEVFAPADDGHKPCSTAGCRKRVLGSDTCMEHDEPEFGSEAWDTARHSRVLGDRGQR